MAILEYQIERHDLDGTGYRKTRVYDMLPVRIEQSTWPTGTIMMPDYWSAVTDVDCPCCEGGQVRWAEAGYVPGYRICDGCGRHFLSDGDSERPTLLRVGSRRSHVA